MTCSCHADPEAQPAQDADQRDTIRLLAALMREIGATRCRYGDVEVDLGPVPVVPVAQVPEPPPEPEPRCPCGCPLDEHGPAGCLNGCEIEKCCGTPDKVPDKETNGEP